jgi:hypothetical protein
MLVLLLLGVALGSVFFPQTVTHTTTQIATQTTTNVTTLTVTTNSSFPLVTATVITVLVEPVIATCTTVSGTTSIVYGYGYLGETTTVTTLFPPGLPHEYQVTQVTASTVTASNQTYVKVPDTC